MYLKTNYENDLIIIYIFSFKIMNVYESINQLMKEIE